jgi:hypothetical protein
MSVDRELAQHIVNYLNELMNLDKPAVGALIGNRVPCNEALADHPTCQVSSQNGGCYVGLLGLLNGLCGKMDEGPWKGGGLIAAEFEKLPDEDKRYRSLTKFVVLDPDSARETPAAVK